MENKVKKRINTFGKVAKIITTIIIICMLVTEGFLLVGGVIAAVVPKESVTVETVSRSEISVDTNYFGVDDQKFYINVGGQKLYIGDFADEGFEIKNEKDGSSRDVNMTVSQYDMHTALWLIVCEMFALAAVIVALYFFRALMKQFMVCDTPFSDGIVKKMHAFAIALIPCMIIWQVLNSVKNHIIGNESEINLLLTTAFVMIIFVLTMIFKYGAELQKEHDETV